ncbi:MAG: ribokinase [Lachnospiraceae bacterium]|nr:ribokinase [Lachnospiraceae bacterium]
MKLAVVGSINIDQTVIAERIPHKGETLHGSELHYIPGGKGANQAVAMARLGADVAMFGCVGDDDNGRKMVDNLRANGVNVDFVKTVPGVPTGIAIITVGENDNTIIVVAGANAKADRGYIDSVKGELLKFDMVVLQHEIPLDTVHYVIELCHEHSIPVVLNPAPAADVPADIIEKVTWLTPNEHEATIIFGPEISTADLLRKYPEKLVITQGSRGVSACLRSGRILTVPVRPAVVADTTGAGDTLNGAFCVRIALGDSVEDALRYANTAASLSTEKFSAQGGMPAADEVQRELDKEVSL